MSERKEFAALALLICNPWPDFQNKHLDRNEMLVAVDALSASLRDVCGAVCSHAVDASRKLFDSKWDTFVLDCQEKEVKVAFVYICSHAIIDSEGCLRLVLKGSDELKGNHLLTKIRDLRCKISQSKVIIFLECCYAGALIPKNDSTSLGISSVGLLQLLHHPSKFKVVEGSGTVLFMSCEREELSTACIFASSLVEILEENKQHVTAKTLVEDVVRMVKSKTRSTWYGRQNPTYLCVPNNIEEIGVIGGCGEVFCILCGVYATCG